MTAPRENVEREREKAPCVASSTTHLVFFMHAPRNVSGLLYFNRSGLTHNNTHSSVSACVRFLKELNRNTLSNKAYGIFYGKLSFLLVFTCFSLHLCQTPTHQEKNKYQKMQKKAVCTFAQLFSLLHVFDMPSIFISISNFILTSISGVYQLESAPPRMNFTYSFPVTPLFLFFFSTK